MTAEERAAYEAGFADGRDAGFREAEERIADLEREIRRARFDLRFRP